MLKGTEAYQTRHINSVGPKPQEHFRLPWDGDTAGSMSPTIPSYSFTGFNLGCLVTQPLLSILKSESSCQILSF